VFIKTECAHIQGGKGARAAAEAELETVQALPAALLRRAFSEEL